MNIRPSSTILTTLDQNGFCGFVQHVTPSGMKKMVEDVSDLGRWFKLWCAAVHDPDLDNLPIADFGRWAKLGAIVKEHGTSGILRCHPPGRLLCSALQTTNFDDFIACVSRLPNVILRRVKSDVSYETSERVSYEIEFRNWLKYQENLSTDRVRRFRAQKRKSETPKRRREEKRREEKRNNKSSNEDSSSRPEMTPQEFVESWNEICASEGLPAVQDLTNGRRAKIRSRLKKYPVLQFWEKVFHGIIHSPYLMGKKRKEGDTWKPDIDWLIRNDENPLKVVEGKYG